MHLQQERGSRIQDTHIGQCAGIPHTGCIPFAAKCPTPISQAWLGIQGCPRILKHSGSDRQWFPKLLRRGFPLPRCPSLPGQESSPLERQSPPHTPLRRRLRWSSPFSPHHQKDARWLRNRPAGPGGPICLWSPPFSAPHRRDACLRRSVHRWEDTHSRSYPSSWSSPLFAPYREDVRCRRCRLAGPGSPICLWSFPSSAPHRRGAHHRR